MRARCKAMFKALRKHYADNPHIEGHYDMLTLTMLKKSGKGPRLRGKASEVRGIVAFTHELAMSVLDADDPMDKSVQQCALHLKEAYECLSHDAPDKAKMGEAARKCAPLWVALEAVSVDSGYNTWRVKPKLHIWLELCEMSLGSDQTKTWTYRDEDFGGAIARMDEHRGGHLSPWVVGRNCLLKICNMHHFPYVTS